MLLKYGNLILPAGHILDLYCVRLSNAAIFCENYTKLYFDAKHLWKGLNKELGKIVGALFSKKCSFWPGAFPDKVTPDIHFIDEAVVQYYVPVVKIIL